MIRRAAFWWLDYVYVTWWQVRHLFGRFDEDRMHRGALPPVLLLPGVYETWQFLRPIAQRLHHRGHPIHIVAALGYNRASIPDAAALAHSYLDLHDLRGVRIVAHSKGGLIGKHMMLFDDAAHRIDSMVAVATPFSGSAYARYFPNRTIRAFLPTEPTLALLAESAAVNGRVTSIFGEFDPHIPAGSHLDGATNVLLPVVGHFRLLSDRRVIAAVENAVAHDDRSGSTPAGVD
ncbi:MAG: esterase/lipase family protein [Microbacteriaceae bacterium]